MSTGPVDSLLQGRCWFGCANVLRIGALLRAQVFELSLARCQTLADLAQRVGMRQLAKPRA